MPDVSLRAAERPDAPAITRILLGVRLAFMPYAPLPRPVSDVRWWVEHELIASGGVTVAEQEGRVVGFVAVGHEPDRRWIHQLHVSPDLVGRSLGSMLLEHALATLAAPIRLVTFEPNHGARRLYERHGFRPLLFTDGRGNEERCPDVLYERTA